MKTIVQLEGEIYTCRTRAERVEKLREFRDATLRAAADRADVALPFRADHVRTAILAVEKPIEPGTLMVHNDNTCVFTKWDDPTDFDKPVPIAGHPTARAVVKDGVLHHYDESGRELRLVPKE